MVAVNRLASNVMAKKLRPLEGYTPSLWGPPPTELTAAPRWVLHRNRRPLQASGRPASSTDPATWTTYEDAKAALAKNPDRFDGVGFALGDGFAGVDLDNAVDETGNLKPWAKDILAAFPNCYAEVSPSGKGLHIFGFGSVPKGVKADVGDGKAEVYSQDRYFTFTGRQWADSPVMVGQAQSALTDLYQRLTGEGTNDKELCRKALAELPEAVEGDGGHDAIYRAAREIYRHGLDGADAAELLAEYNAEKASPPFSERELKHKLESARDAALRERDFGTKATKVGEKAFDLELVGYQDFKVRDFERSFLVDGLVVSGECLIVGGPKKALKTSISLDLALSIATGSPFLGQFEIPEPSPVIVVSGESGGATLQDTAARISASKGVEPTNDMLAMGLKCPKLSVDVHLDAIRRAIQARGARMFFVDPAYLATLTTTTAGQAGNVFAMGTVLQGYGEIGAETGCAMVLVHHSGKGAARRGTTLENSPPELDDLTQSGFAEWARQWLLVKPKEAFQHGRHSLWLQAGGSAGQSGLFTVEVDEGRPDDPLQDRKWGVEVFSEDEANRRKTEAEEAERAKKLEINEGRILARLAERELSLNKLSESAGMNKKTALETLASLQQKGRVSKRVGQSGVNVCDLYSAT